MVVHICLLAHLSNRSRVDIHHTADLALWRDSWSNNELRLSFLETHISGYLGVGQTLFLAGV
jgi:hypothetical protein